MNIVEKIRTEYRRKKLFSTLLVTLAISVSAGVLSGLMAGYTPDQQILTGVVSFVICITAWLAVGGFQKTSDQKIIRYLDRHYPFLEESASLLVARPKTVLEEWQREKISAAAEHHYQEIKTTNRLIKRSAILFFVIIFTAGAAYIMQPFTGTTSEIVLNEFEAETEYPDETEKMIPEIEHAEMNITPPSYTDLPQRTEGRGNIRVAEGSQVEWVLQANSETEHAFILFADRSEIPLEKSGNQYRASAAFTGNHIYQLAISNRDTTIVSEYYGISVRPDQPPAFRFIKPAEQRTVITNDDTIVDVEFRVLDDFGVTDLSIHATLARGSGENVQFSEQQLSFERVRGLGSAEVTAAAVIHPGSLQMRPGDELYFHVRAQDNRPDPQTARSETYFVIFSDTTRAGDIPFGSVVVDLMPEYLRSQRQIIIDTEQLLEDQSSIDEAVFKSRSETIGRDQNLLRLRYGFYLGQDDEGEGGGVIGDPFDDHSDHGHEDHELTEEHIHEEELDQHGLDEAQSEAAELIPHEFFHDHGSAEMNTLFGESPRAMLQQALANMWNAEVYLRTGRPAEALPYEYAALEFLQAAQQAERRYLRKAGYDVPPVPEDEKRLTGEYDDFASPAAEHTAELQDHPLLKLQHLIRERSPASAGMTELAESWINEADIPDSDRLYLLNRLLDAENNGVNETNRQEILQRITELIPELNRDPAPLRRPSLNRSGL